MEHAASLVLGLLFKLLAVMFDAIGMVEGALRHLLEGMGVTGSFETLVLVLVGIALLITAFQVFGRLFLVLLAIFFILLVLHALLPAAGVPHHAVS